MGYETYETGIPIGRGAAGEVFKAWDPAAERTVALKLFAEDTDGVRLEREAQAQAGLDHPSICEIYEVGSTGGGRGFIAMRYVDGEPLDAVCARLPVRRRVELLVQVVDAVAAAHRAGLVHRDLKPSNLLVEEQDDGTLRAFVLDFGIVQVLDETRLTETGHVLGTPGYLSPEQARGVAVDERSDIFSLGVLLYQLLTGELPFDAVGVGAVLQVLEHEPPLAHAVRPGIPPELGHIAAKAMEKDPRRRYRDAGALARDLQRFLDGAATTARSVGPVGRLVRRIERRPQLWLAGLLLLLIALGAVVWGAVNNLWAERQARDAERFARRAGELAAEARYLELLPRRSLDAEHRALEAKVQELAGDVDRAEGRAVGAGLYALGRAEASLGRMDRAREHFAAARGAGFDDDALAVDESLVLLDEARERLRKVELLRDPDSRRQTRAQVLEELRDRLPRLQPSSADGEPLQDGDRLLIDAAAALLDGQAETAREAAMQVRELQPWRIEADLIVADTYRERASDTFMGEDDRATADALAAEEQVLQDALLRAPAAGELHRRHCENRLTLALAALAVGRVDGAITGDAWQTAFDEAADACARAVEIRPSDLRSRSTGLEVAWRSLLARVSGQGVDDSMADEARRLTEQAQELLQVDGAGATELHHLGNTLLTRAQIERELGRPTPELYVQAADALTRSLDAAPESAFGWQSLGIVWIRHGEALDAAGEDSRPSYAQAVEALHRGLNGVSGAEAKVWNSICLAWINTAYFGVGHPKKMDPESVDQALDDGEKACGESLSRSPDYVSALSNLGLLYWTRVEWEIGRGGDPGPAFTAARQTFDRLFALAPEKLSGRSNFAGLTAAMARHVLDGLLGSDPPGDQLEELIAGLVQAQDALGPVLERYPFDGAVNLSRLQMLEAAALCAAGRPSGEAFRRAEQTLGRFSDQDGWLGLRRLLWARFHLRRAECALSEDADGDAGGAGRADVEAGLALVDAVLQDDPASAEAAQLKDRLTALTDSQP